MLHSLQWQHLPTLCTPRVAAPPSRDEPCQQPLSLKKRKNLCVPLYFVFLLLSFGLKFHSSQMFGSVVLCREHQNVETMMINNSSGLVNSGTAARKFRWGFSGRFCRRMWQLMCRCVDAALLLGEPGALQRAAACDAATPLLCS